MNNTGFVAIVLLIVVLILMAFAFILTLKLDEHKAIIASMEQRFCIKMHNKMLSGEAAFIKPDGSIELLRNFQRKVDCE